MPRFGTFRVILDDKLGELFNMKAGIELKPSEFVVVCWKYVKEHNLTKK